ncbi:MAG: aminoacyl-tRNA hydrolase [Gammaproteobacteria bacterium]|jgi:PTH1 family peptidyl-tRNA hydrolase|nr:MAG: peptidyl-tRNA hydrolase [Gammaproteobacteria bacterium SG8_31]
MTEHEPIRIIAGLGNPGARYQDTRHNAGFWFVDILANRYGGTFKEERRFQSELARVEIDGREVRLLKPYTFMNRSGNAIKSLCAYLKISPESVMVVHDDLDLPVGTVRLKRGGGAGGHNGLKDVIAHLGREFFRLRIGVGHPGRHNEVIDYVLANPGREENRSIRASIEEAADVMPVLLGQGEQPAMHRLHTRSQLDADASGDEG